MQEVEGVAFSQFTQQCLEEDSGERGADRFQRYRETGED